MQGCILKRSQPCATMDNQLRDGGHHGVGQFGMTEQHVQESPVVGVAERGHDLVEAVFADDFYQAFTRVGSLQSRFSYNSHFSEVLVAGHQFAQLHRDPKTVQNRWGAGENCNDLERQH